MPSRATTVSIAKATTVCTTTVGHFIQKPTKCSYVVKGARAPVCAYTEATAITAFADYDGVSLLRDRPSGSVNDLPSTTTSSVVFKAAAAASNDQHIHGDQVRVRDPERAV